ncbi:MAG: hypothetical protein PVI79_13925, partial [Gammaproteobacteria bacterium]
TTTGADGTGVLLAFNTIGWESQSIFATGIDALLGTSIGTPRTASVKAVIEDSHVDADGNIDLGAISKASITATITNEATAAASALLGASASSYSGILAANRVNSEALAYIDNADAAAGDEILAGGGISILADDTASIHATTELEATSSSSNDGGAGILNSLAGALLDGYQYSSSSASQTLDFGDRVRVASTYLDAEYTEADTSAVTGGERVLLDNGDVYSYTGSGIGGPSDLSDAAQDYANNADWEKLGGSTETVYEYMGTDGSSVDLQLQDYSNKDLWKQLDDTNVIPSAIATTLLKATGIEGAVGGSKALSGLVARNDVVSNVDAYIVDAKVTASDGDVAIAATEAASIFARDNSVVSAGSNAKAGVVVTNIVLSQADAQITRSDINASDASGGAVDVGNVLVEASNSSTIDALAHGSVSGGKALGFTIAFNSIGWQAQDLLTQGIDALIGAPLIAEASDPLYTVDTTPLSGDLDFRDVVELASSFAGLGEAGARYEWQGTAAEGENLNLLSEDYTDSDRWRELLDVDVFGGVEPARAQAYVQDSAITADGDLTLDAVSAAQLKADVSGATKSEKTNSFAIAAKWGANGQASGGLLVGNKVASSAQAYIDNSGIALLPGTPDIDIGGNIRIFASDTAGDNDIIALEPAFKSSEFTATAQAVDPGDVVELDDLTALNGGSALQAGHYRFIGDLTETIDLQNEDFSDGSRWQLLRAAGIEARMNLEVASATTNNLDALKSLAGQLGLDDYEYTSASGQQTLNPGEEGVVAPGPDPYNPDEGYLARIAGDRVWVSQSFIDANNLVDGNGVALQEGLYEYIGAGETLDLSDAADADYANTARWMRLGQQDFEDILFPEIGNLTDSNSVAYGGMVVINDMRGAVRAYIEDAVVNADGNIEIDAIEDASIRAIAKSTVTSSGGSAFGTGKSVARQGQIVTNLVNASADAYIVGSHVTTTSGSAGDITLEADNAALLDATLRSSTQTGDTADAISLAFNSVGWQPQNVLFNTIDAILGDPLVSKAFNGELDADAEHLTRAHAHITDSTVDADGNVSLDAYNDAQLNATVSNAAESAASALFGAGGQAFGAVLASNKVSGEAKAWVDGTSSVDAGAGICVNAEDNTGIYANSKIVSSSITTNDGGAAAIQETLNDVVPVDYDTGNALLSPSVDLKFGDRIRLSDSFSDDTVSGAGNDGSIYIFLGDAAAGTGLDLRNLDYTDLELFKQDPVTNLVPQGLNVSESDSKALGGLIVLNDVRAGVEAYIDGVDVTAKDGDIAITALENATIDATTDGSVVSSGGSAFGTGTSSAKNGVVATNVVQSSASAWSQSNTLSASDAGSGLGNLLVDAKNTSALDATTKGSTQSGDSAVGAVLAFNSVGWNASNVLFNAVDALLGDPIVSEAFDGAGDGAVEAYLREVKVVADGDLDVHAEASGSINAMLDNDATSAASALIDASGSAAAVVLASNKVNSSADAWIDNSGLILDPALPDIDIGGALTVESKDTAAITADTSLKAMSTVTNDAGASMLADLADAAIRDYLFTNLSGFVHIEQGQQVYVGDSHAAGGLAGSIYRYTGAGEDVDLSTTNFEAGPWSELNPVDFSSDQGLQSVQAGIPSLGIVPQAVLDAFLPSEYEGTVVRVMEGANAGGNVGSNYRYVGEDGMLDLSTQDYSDTENWVEVTGTVSSIVSELPLNVSDSDSSAVGALFVVNDVRSDVDAVIDHATVLADGDVSVIALENAGIVASDSSTVTSAGGSLTGGSSTAINGVVATNAVLSGADAHIANSDIETTGDAQVIVDADNTSLINAVVESNTKSNGTSVGVTLAFNTIGWNSQNFLFNTLDAVLGTDIGSANPSKVEAYILHSDVLAGGGIDIGAGSSANIDATIETGTTSIVTGVSTSKAVSVGAIVAMNKINTGASAYIDSSNSIVASDGDI